MSSADDDHLAIFGGKPVRPGGPIERTPNRPEIQAALERAYLDGDWHRYHGLNTEKLKEALARFHGVPHIELCCSGTAALEIALKGVNVKSGDEVLVSGYDFKGIVSSVLAVGAVPVVVDIDPIALAPSKEIFSKGASDRTKALVVSHLHGCAAPVKEIVEWARPNGIGVIEDACQSPGATNYGGKRAGSFGDVGVLSFGGSKLLTAGRGGALLTSDSRIAQRIRLFCERGNHAFPLSELQAAVLIPQLERLDEDNRVRAKAVGRLIDLFEYERPSVVTLFGSDIDASAFYKYGLLFDSVPKSKVSEIPRSAVSQALRAEGIAIDEGFQSVPELFARSRFRAEGELSEALQMGRRILVLHHPVLLAGDDELDLVVRAIRKVAAAMERGDFEHVPSP